ncbi:MAG TPA: aliphatic sulfonate ABC transporter substrate-binding protein [Clostridium sp.]
MKIKKIFAILLIVISSLGALTACGSKSSNTNNISGVTAKEVRIATQPSPFGASVFVAKEKGWIEEELKKLNVTVKWTSFAAGPPMNESFAAGQQDIGIMGDVPAIVAKASGQKTNVIANASYGEKTLALIVKPDSIIKDAKELKGKKVAYVKGSYGHHLLGLVLENAGLTLNDVESINLPVADISTAVTSGEVDAGVVWEPSLTKAVNAGQVKVLIDGTGIKRANVFFIANENFAKSNPKIIEAYVKALNKASEYIKSNSKEAAKVIQPDINISANELANLIPKYNFSPIIDDEDIKELKDVEKFLRTQKLTTTSVNIDNFVDTQYLRSSGLVK